ncbi:MAG: hypothetical protein VX425_08570 [Pseudomonadota bacterium]|nr:hypothetical protein [Pseudomonadota bacterium]
MAKVSMLVCAAALLLAGSLVPPAAAQTQPECFCSADFDPVCSLREQKTYSNACLAECAAALPFRPGACEPAFPEGIIVAPEAPFAPDRGDGWYFREMRIDLRPGQLGPELPFPLLGADQNALSVGFPGFDGGALSLLGDQARINVICPRGYVATGCLGGTVPAAIGNVQYAGGLETESPPAQLRADGAVSSGFDQLTGCLTSVRFDTPLDLRTLLNTRSVFVKAQAYCMRVGPQPQPQPQPQPPRPRPPVSDPCDCRTAAEEDGNLGCRSDRTSALLGCDTDGGERLCYVSAKCPGFRLSNFADRRERGEYYKCVPRAQC